MTSAANRSMTASESTDPLAPQRASQSQQSPSLPGERSLDILNELPEWGNVVTIVLHGGCVFEFKGPFPRGEVGRGYLNLDGPVPGFHGHLKLDAIDHIGFQDRPHAGRASYALTFNDAAGNNLFKVFLGRDAEGQHFPKQRRRFDELRQQAAQQQGEIS